VKIKFSKKFDVEDHRKCYKTSQKCPSTKQLRKLLFLPAVFSLRMSPTGGIRLRGSIFSPASGPKWRGRYCLAAAIFPPGLLVFVHERLSETLVSHCASAHVSTGRVGSGASPASAAPGRDSSSIGFAPDDAGSPPEGRAASVVQSNGSPFAHSSPISPLSKYVKEKQ
jgi:hypothetical protein